MVKYLHNLLSLFFLLLKLSLNCRIPSIPPDVVKTKLEINAAPTLINGSNTSITKNKAYPTQYSIHTSCQEYPISHQSKQVIIERYILYNSVQICMQEDSCGGMMKSVKLFLCISRIYYVNKPVKKVLWNRIPVPS